MNLLDFNDLSSSANKHFKLLFEVTHKLLLGPTFVLHLRNISVTNNSPLTFLWYFHPHPFEE